MDQNQTRKFIYNILSQNVLTPPSPNCILPTHFYNSSMSDCSDIFSIYIIVLQAPIPPSVGMPRYRH